MTFKKFITFEIPGEESRDLDVAALSIEPSESGIRLVALATQDVTPELDAARFKAELFERAFATRLEVVASPDPSYDASSFDNERSAAEIDAASLSG